MAPAILQETTNIRSTHQLVEAEANLLDLMREEVKSTSHRDVVIMAGHFMLFIDEEKGCLVPGVIEEQQSQMMRDRIARRVGIFPVYTWHLGVQLAREWAGTFGDIKFLLLINDWQYVPTQGGSAPELRKKFYESFDRLPAMYLDLLQQGGVFSTENVLPSRKHPLIFPETWLKYRFQKSAEKFVKEGKLAKRVLDAERNDSEVSFLDADGNYTPLISCGVTGCAGEVTEMIWEVYKTGRRFMIIFAPGECYQPVHTGVEVALNLYNLAGMKVVIVDPGGSGEMSVEEIYQKMVNFTVMEYPAD